jgi:hypothetical protein
VAAALKACPLSEPICFAIRADTVRSWSGYGPLVERIRSALGADALRYPMAAK